MSVNCLHWAFEYPSDKSTANHVLVYLAYQADEEGFYPAPVVEIAAACHLSKKTVRQCLQFLESRDYLKIIPRYLYDGSQVGNGYQLWVNSIPKTKG